MSIKPLSGKTVLVTRPAEQAGELAGRIAEAGGRALLFPAIELCDVEDEAPFFALVDRLEEFDFAVFISPNAVARAMKRILGRRALPAGLRMVAVGGGSVRALAGHGIRGVIAPQGRYDSEALLELAELSDPRGKRVVIFRGQGGRELLGETLSARGAHVEYAECYRRCRPATDPAPLLEAWRRQELHAVTATSSESLRNLFHMVGQGRDALCGTPLFVPHPRIAQSAHELRMKTVIVTGPGDAGLLTGLTAYFGPRAGT
jgi:uroporphyrinogen-III synthase